MPKKKAGDKPVLRNVLLADITADMDVQARVELSEETIAEYGAAMLEQIQQQHNKFPPAIVFDDGKTLWLSDGFHRFTAASRIGIKDPYLYCEIREGTKRDAMLCALGANATHGLRPSNEDKRKAVSRMLLDEEWRQWADREIARLCGVVHSYVGKVRAEVQEATGGVLDEDEEQRRTYVTKHGTKSTMKTGGRRKKQKPAKGDGNDQAVEDDETSSVAEPDLGAERHHDDGDQISDVAEGSGADAWPDRGVMELMALRSANEKLSQDKRGLEARVTLLEDENTSLRSGAAGSDGSLNEFQATIGKWESLVETQRAIIARLEHENASLRASAAAASTGEPQTMTQLFNRAVDMLELLDGELSEGPNRWPKKVSAKSRNQQINEVHSFLGRLRGFRDVIELHSGESEEEQS
jgi:hypothetical protein